MVLTQQSRYFYLRCAQLVNDHSTNCQRKHHGVSDAQPRELRNNIYCHIVSEDALCALELCDKQISFSLRRKPLGAMLAVSRQVTAEHTEEIELGKVTQLEFRTDVYTNRCISANASYPIPVRCPRTLGPRHLEVRLR
jgi:hypothetical protein